MIPVRLELHNFLAYRDPAPLELEGIHIACLAGPNGAGKSSLLDAMTWALWGKARAKRDDDLIHANQSEMLVALTFELEGNLYKAQRARKRGKRSTSTLDLQIMDGDLWRSLTEGTMRETQAKINRILRLDYDTFINSVFLLQGRADEFTIRTPAQRKEILAEILGLSVWERYEERAKAQLKDIGQEEAALETELTGIDAELQREDEYERQLIDAQAEALELSKQLEAAQEMMREIEAARSQRTALQSQQTDLERRLAQGEGELEALMRQLEEAQARLEGFDAVLAEREDIEAGYGQWAEARARQDEFGGKLMEQQGLSQQQTELEATLAEARSALSSDQRVLSEKAADLERTIAGADPDGTLVDVRADVEGLEAQQGERESLMEQVAALNEERAGLESENRSLKKQMDVLERQLSQVQNSGATCPLCGQPLDEAHRADLTVQFEREGAEHAELYRDNQSRLDAIMEQTATLNAEVDVLEGELKRLPARQQQLAVLEERGGRAGEAAGELEAVRAQLAGLEAQLAGEDYAAEAQAQLAAVREELASVGYDEAAHREAREAAETYQSYEARHAELERALTDGPQVEASLADLQERAEKWEATLAEDRQTQASLADEVAALDAQLEGAEDHERELERVRQDEAEARMQVGAAEQRLKTLDDLRDRRQDLLARQDELAGQRSIYDELRVAFSKNGIPAMIIDAAIPELQETANLLLARMTEGRMHVQLSTQREKVTGGVAETLDILIHDGQSTRDYETFSGGEAMRINFALRIALSKLLARRAGAQLRTLVIDEGFGSQDAQGRERLMEAINSVQDDFDLILVITHLDELKDRFPVRVEISKTPDGSQIELV